MVVGCVYFPVGEIPGFGSAVSVSPCRAPVSMPAVYVVSVSFSFLFALSACLVLCYGREYVGYWRGRLCVACVHMCVLCFKGETSALSSSVLTCLPFHICLFISLKEPLHFSSRSDSLKDSGIKCTLGFYLPSSNCIKICSLFKKQSLLSYILFLTILCDILWCLT